MDSALVFDREIISMRPYRHFGRHLGHMTQRGARQGARQQDVDLRRRGNLQLQRYHGHQFQRRQIGIHGQAQGGLRVDLCRIEHAVIVGAFFRVDFQRDRKIARQQHGVDQVADDEVQLAEAGRRVVVQVARQVTQRVFPGKRHQAAGQRCQVAEQLLRMVAAMVGAMAEGGDRRAEGIEHPERGHVAAVKLHRVVARLPVAAVQRDYFRAQALDQRVEHFLQGRVRIDGQARRQPGGIDLEAATPAAAQAHQRDRQIVVQRFAVPQQADGFFQVGHRHADGFAVQVGRFDIVLLITGTGCQVAAMRLHRRQRRIEREAVLVGRQPRQVDRGRQGIAERRFIDLAVLEHQRHGVGTQAVVRQRIGIPAERMHAPQVRADQGHQPLQPRFMITIQLLELLRADGQPFRP